jgi:two-component system sensor histidine kinase RegB
VVERTASESGASAFASLGESQLRLQTIVRLRWVAVLGQLAAVAGVFFGLGFSMPIGQCLGFIALSAWLNVYLSVRYPARHRLSTPFATVMLGYDILQLAGLLYLTGGIENPFTFLLVAPVTVSAATLPPRNTVLLGLMAAAAAALLVFYYWPLPWYQGLRLDMPFFYKIGVLIAVCACMTFLALYVWRLSNEARLMSAALAATELVLAREQKLHALDGLAAAAAHELGTPLGTIVLVTRELEHALKEDSRFAEDVALLRSQAQRCREILQKLTRRPSEEDPLHARLIVRELIEEAAGPYRLLGVAVEIAAGPASEAAGEAAREPVGHRRPGVIYGLGNIIENAVDFARTRVEVRAEWSETEVVVTIADDGPGFPIELMETLGEPYVTTRPAASQKRDGHTSGLGLGFFIAKTLLERSGATIALENRPPPAKGALVRIFWPRPLFERKGIGAAAEFAGAGP